jgi:hypothetical protein
MPLQPKMYLLLEELEQQDMILSHAQLTPLYPFSYFQRERALAQLCATNLIGATASLTCIYLLLGSTFHLPSNHWRHVRAKYTSDQSRL